MSKSPLIIIHKCSARLVSLSQRIRCLPHPVRSHNQQGIRKTHRTTPAADRYRLHTFLLPFLLFLLVTLSLLTSPSLAREKHKNILIINSYHVGYKWTDDTLRAIRDAFDPFMTDLSLYIEYLDMKRYYSEERYYQTALWLGQKYHEIPIDLIISTDDTAFRFLKEFGQTLFPDIPVFFCGTNYLEEQDISNLPNFYGITEKADIDATFEAILNLLPKTQQIFIINDTTVTGRQVHREIEQAIRNFRDRVDFVFLEDITMPDLIYEVNNLPPDSVIFYTFFFRDSSGQVFEYDQSIKLLSRQSSRPIFGAWDFNLDLGIVGGMLTSGHLQGTAVANLALAWLHNGRLKNLPKLGSSPNRFFFDYRELRKFGLKKADLPPESTIINMPESFLHKHLKVLFYAGIAIILLVVVILFLVLNIRRRKRAEIKLKLSEQNFRNIFNNTREGLFQSTREGRFLWVNPALAKMLKCDSPEDMIGHYTDIGTQLFQSPGDWDSFINLNDETGWSRAELRVKCKDGSEIDVIAKLRSVYDEKGELLYYEGSIIDLTEYKQTQELIAQTDKMLSLGGVSAGIAHEIRSPLSSIVLGSQLLSHHIEEETEANCKRAQECGTTFEAIRSYCQKSRISKLAEEILTSGMRVDVIIKDMLSYSRQSIGEFEPEPIPKIVREAIKLIRKDSSLRTNGNLDEIVFHEKFEDTLPDVYCSASKIQQVCFNILRNGVEAMWEAGTDTPQVTVGAAVDNDMVQISISDNGPGMDAELQQRIFQPFFTTKGAEKGTGLGLSVSSFIVEDNHNGNLQVKSKPGEGTTFLIRLPINQ